MRLGIFSDIHANLEALEACMAAAPPYDFVANLGDVVGYGGSPNEVIERSRDLLKPRGRFYMVTKQPIEVAVMVEEEFGAVEAVMHLAVSFKFSE